LKVVSGGVHTTHESHKTRLISSICIVGKSIFANHSFVRENMLLYYQRAWLHLENALNKSYFNKVGAYIHINWLS